MPQSSQRALTRKSRGGGGGTSASHTRLRDSLELNGVQVTKMVQVMTVDVEMGAGDSGSTSESSLEMGKGSRGHDGLDGIDPRTMGYQAEVVGGRLNRGEIE
jgi:hypothetical protein